MKRFFLFIVLFSTTLSLGCASKEDHLAKFREELVRFPEYSVILLDMKGEGAFSKSFYHKYRIAAGRMEKGKSEMTIDTADTDWYQVSQSVYKKYENYLGMTILSKDADGKVVDTAFPPGYQYVGDSKYGQWRTDSSGNSFWEFYGKYMMFRSVLGMATGNIFRSDYNNYRDYRDSGRPYYGPNREYGTYGNNSMKSNKDFFERRKQKEMAKKTSFNDRVKQRIGRSRTNSFRSRSGGFGK